MGAWWPVGLLCSRKARPVGKVGVLAPQGRAGENGKEALVGRAQEETNRATIDETSGALPWPAISKLFIEMKLMQ